MQNEDEPKSQQIQNDQQIINTIEPQQLAALDNREMQQLELERKIPIEKQRTETRLGALKLCPPGE